MNSQILKIDEEFKQLIHPLKRQEYLQLESNILADIMFPVYAIGRIKCKQAGGFPHTGNCFEPFIGRALWIAIKKRHQVVGKSIAVPDRTRRNGFAGKEFQVFFLPVYAVFAESYAQIFAGMPVVFLAGINIVSIPVIVAVLGSVVENRSVVPVGLTGSGSTFPGGMLHKSQILFVGDQKIIVKKLQLAADIVNPIFGSSANDIYSKKQCGTGNK